jgi:hypothetical protein
MTFETHSDTQLVQGEELPEGFSQALMPGWTADEYIRDNCPNIKANYRKNRSDKYGYLYHLINKGLIAAEKYDGFWFYSKESLDKFEKFDAIHTRIVNSDFQHFEESKRVAELNIVEAKCRIEDINNTIRQLTEELSDTITEIQTLEENLKEMKPPRMSRKFRKDLREWKKEPEIARTLDAKWFTDTEAYGTIRPVADFARKYKCDNSSQN